MLHRLLAIVKTHLVLHGILDPFEYLERHTSIMLSAGHHRRHRHFQEKPVASS